MKRNYPGIASLIAFACAVPVPLTIALVHRSRFETFAQQQGPGMLWMIVLWVGVFTIAGVILAAVGLFLSRRGFGGRTASIVGLVLNTLFLILQVRNI